MIHAWVDTDHDNQLGVFGMWNDTIAPELGGEEMFDRHECALGGPGGGSSR